MDTSLVVDKVSNQHLNAPLVFFKSIHPLNYHVKNLILTKKAKLHLKFTVTRFLHIFQVKLTQVPTCCNKRLPCGNKQKVESHVFSAEMEKGKLTVDSLFYIKYALVLIYFFSVEKYGSKQKF